jgi:L,D-peptidoglycan transpeptidase YkuD (ErfK/YbiS/YcfS/YnhG family)
MNKLPAARSRILTRPITSIVVRKRAIPDSPHLARLHVGPVVIPAAVGKAGTSHCKREGDGASPIGSFDLKMALFRNDRLSRISSLIGFRPVKRTMGWCDDPASGRYNRPIPAGAKVSHERLWRDDGVYDVVIPTSHNERPRVLGAGSAIFLHVARSGYAPTEGCVAISLPDLRRLLPRLSRRARLIIIP